MNYQTFKKKTLDEFDERFGDYNSQEEWVSLISGDDAKDFISTALDNLLVEVEKEIVPDRLTPHQDTVSRGFNICRDEVIGRLSRFKGSGEV